MNNSELFEKNRYLDLKGIIPIDLCRVVTKYALLKEETCFEPELGESAQVKNAHSVYGDTLMETLLFFLQPHIEKNTGLEVFPTYSYYRVYRPGMILEKHKDRPSCEISATVCFGFKYFGTDPTFRWGMYIDSPNGQNLVTQDPGDVIIYRGCELDHWRDPFKAEENSYQVQAFLHFINKNGPFYPEFCYDKRPGIGYLNKKHK